MSTPCGYCCGLTSGRAIDPIVTVLDSRTLRYTPGSSHRPGCGGAKRKEDSKVHAAVNLLLHLPALHVTPATEDRAQVKELAGTMQEKTGKRVGLTYVARGYSGTELAAEAETQGIRLEVVKHPGAQLRLDGALSALSEGLQAVARYRGRPALRRSRLPLSPPSDRRTRVEPTRHSS